MKGDEKMPKINIKVTIINSDKKLEQKYNAIFHPQENEIVYQEEDKTITKLKIENEKIKLRRNNNELEMEYIFGKTVIRELMIGRQVTQSIKNRRFWAR